MSISYTMLKHHIWSCALSIVSLFLFLILWGCNGVNSTSHKVDSSDTIYSAQKAMEIYDYNPNRAMLIIDSSEIKYMRLSIVASIVAFLLALAFAIYFFSQRCKMSTKNKILTAQISEANKYKIKYTELTEAKTKEETENEAYNQQEDDSKLSIDDTTDYVKVFEIMSAAIISKQLYLAPNMGRQTLIDLFGVSKEVVGSAFAKGSKYGSLTSFINTCRLTHAVKLLDDNKEMSIKEIALASGYYNVNTFSRNFKAKYSMSPSEYRIIKT